ncbi:MAG TPA: hypothetical protein VMD04_02610, partial [Candidatus Margulisiibacteriota bacterium]|nr:hypothetical protein [Candidatus Margulisiibacteriota bacterium]
FIYIVIAGYKKNGRGILFSFLIISLATIAFGGYPYIRNFFLTGNIFYPIRMTILGRTVMPGFIDRLDYANMTYHFNEFSLKKLFFSEGFGLQLFAFILPGTFLPLLLCIFYKKKDGFIRCLFYLIPLSIFLLLIYYLRAYWSRYFYGYLGMALAAAAVYLSEKKWGRRYMAIASVLCVLSSIPELARREQLYLSLFLSLLFFLSAFLRRQGLSLRLGRLQYTLPVALFLVLSILIFILDNKYEKEQYARYSRHYLEKDIALGWSWLNSHSRDARIAYAGRPETYPLYGSRLKNHVSYVPVNSALNMPHAFPDGNYRGQASYDVWAKNLEQEKIKFIFIYQMHYSRDFPLEDSWAGSHPDKFTLVFSNPKVRIYERRLF